jgi:hypothetical protein
MPRIERSVEIDRPASEVWGGGGARLTSAVDIRLLGPWRLLEPYGGGGGRWAIHPPPSVRSSLSPSIVGAAEILQWLERGRRQRWPAAPCALGPACPQAVIVSVWCPAVVATVTSVPRLVSTTL